MPTKTLQKEIAENNLRKKKLLNENLYRTGSFYSKASHSNSPLDQSIVSEFLDHTIASYCTTDSEETVEENLREVNGELRAVKISRSNPFEQKYAMRVRFS